MTVLDIGGTRVEVDDEFLSLSPEEQQSAVAEIAASLKLGGPAPDARPDWAWKGSIGGIAYDLANWGVGAEGYEPSALPFLDPINAAANGFVDQIPVVGPVLSSWGNEVDAWVNNALGFAPQTAEDRANINAGEAARFPQMDLAGRVAGTVVPLAALGSTQLGGQMLGVTGNLGQQALMGAVSGGVLGGADTAMRGGTTEEIRGMGVLGAAGGAAGPVLGRYVVSPVAQAIFGGGPSTAAKMLANGLKGDQLDPSNLQNAIANVSDSAVLADLGPNLQAQAAAIATMPNDARRTVIEALAGRKTEGNARIKAAVEDILGPAVAPSEFAAHIDAARQSLSPLYRQALANAKAVETGDLALKLDSLSVTSRGDVQQHARKIREMLNVAGTDQLERDPAVLLEIRQELDDMFGRASPSARHEKAFLANVRQQIDGMLAEAAPGIKEVDRQFSSLMQQQEAFDLGQTVLDGGRGTVHPSDLDNFLAGASDDVLSSLSAGTRAEIDRIVGTSANDRAALAQLLKGKGSWNHSRLASAFGEEKADQLLRVIGNERLMAETENMALGGSQTAARQAAQNELSPKRDTSVAKEAMNLQFGNAAARLADKALGGVIERGRQEAMKELAAALMGKGDSPLLSEVARLLGEHQRGILSAPAIGPLLLGPEPREPVRITVVGGN